MKAKLGLLGLLTACSPSAAKLPPLRVVAPASLGQVMPALGQAWSERSGTEVVVSTAGTPRVVAQLRAGAPADLVLTADALWMDALEHDKLVVQSTRISLMSNRLVLVTPAGAGPLDLDALVEQNLRLALAGENVPAGRYAKQALESSGHWSALQGQIVRGDSVRTALAWVARGEVDAAIVYDTDRAGERRVALAYAFPDGSYTQVQYPAALVRGGQPVAQEFLDFCASPEGARVLQQAGFVVHP